MLIELVKWTEPPAMGGGVAKLFHHIHLRGYELGSLWLHIP